MGLKMYMAGTYKQANVMMHGHGFHLLGRSGRSER
jgi:hypothetical protein